MGDGNPTISVSLGARLRGDRATVRSRSYGDARTRARTVLAAC